MQFLMNKKLLILMMQYILLVNALIWRKYCQSHTLLLGSERNMAKVVDASNGQVIQLQCHFCEEKDNRRPKVWFRRPRGVITKPTEVPLGMNKNPDRNKFSVSPTHTLTIRDVSYNDSGVYSCHLFNIEDSENIFTFVLEGVPDEVISPKIGKMRDWKEYKRTKIDPVNQKFYDNSNAPLQHFQENFNFTFRVVTSWEPWGPCETSHKTKGAGLKRREGLCRLHPLTKLNYVKESNDTFIKEITDYFQNDDFDVSCRSFYLSQKLTEISNIVRKIPYFEQHASCTDVADVPGPKTVASYKFKSTKKIPEYSHVTLACPETNLESNIRWLKNGKELNSTFRNNIAESEEEPHLTIDSFSTLYILHATKDDEGDYACQVGEVKMMSMKIEVESIGKKISEEFVRYSTYLGFVLTLSLVCYCTGIAVACKKKDSFLDIYKEQENDDEERLLD